MPAAGLRNGNTSMQRPPNKSRDEGQQEWAQKISDLRHSLNLSQTDFGQRLRMSAMAISRWERAAQEPTAASYIDLGNLAGDPLCWYFWARAGLGNEDLMRVLPNFRKRLGRSNMVNLRIATAGSGRKKSKLPQLVAVPLLKVVVASHGGKGDISPVLDDAPVESAIAAPNEWCPNPSTSTCLRVSGNSMAPLIHEGYILAVDSSQHDRSKLEGQIVIGWNKNKGLTVSRLKRYGQAELLQPENREYEPIVLNGKEKWLILAKVLWWIGKES
ncbi:MAG: XRE family transcriptional regulator [Acidobacteriia bacterium]|nr:XRE family transcriptional regulator [Terriglobia bacterium]